MHNVIYMLVEHILGTVKAQIFRDDADAILPEQAFSDFFGFVNGHGELAFHQAEVDFQRFRNSDDRIALEFDFVLVVRPVLFFRDV